MDFRGDTCLIAKQNPTILEKIASPSCKGSSAAVALADGPEFALTFWKI
jgi:hypothetical protein